MLIYQNQLRHAGGNIAFRADSLAATFYMYKRAVVWSGLSGIVEQLRTLKESLAGFGSYEALAVVGLIGLLQVICDFRQYAGKSNQEIVTKRATGVRWVIYLIAVFTVLIYSVSGETAFIYFKF